MKRMRLIVVTLLVFSPMLFGQVERWVYAYDHDGLSDAAQSIAYGPDGSTYIAGLGGVQGTLARSQFIVISLAPDGTRRWLYAHPITGNQEEWASSVVYGTDGNIYVTGTMYAVAPPYTNYDFVVACLDANTGAENWIVRSELPDADGGLSLAYNSIDGCLYGAGHSSVGLYNVFTVYKVDPHSLPPRFLWSYQYHPADRGLGRAVACANDRVYATGQSGSIYMDLIVLCLDCDGGFVWDRRYGAEVDGHDDGRSICLDDAGNVYAGGFLANGASGGDFVVVSLTGGGQERWLYTYDDQGVNGLDEACSVASGADGYIYASGSITKQGNHGPDFAVVSLRPTGLPLERWVYTYDGSGGTIDRSNMVTCGGDGHIYAAGYTNNTYGDDASSQDFTVVSLRASDGGANWPAPYMYPGRVVGGSDQAYCVTQGLDGDVYAAGYSTQSGIYTDFTVIRINPTAGLFAGSTEPSSGRHLGRELGTNKLHAVYHTASQGVCYSFSPDGGQTWTQPALIDQGMYPSVGVLSLPIPINMPPAVVYLNPLGGELRYRYYDVWTQRWLGFSIQPPGAVCNGPPSVYVTGTTVHVAYPTIGMMGYSVYYNAFEYWAPDPGNYEEVGSDFSELTLPSLVCDGNWVPHVIYEKNNRLEYAFKDQAGLWDHNYQIGIYPGSSTYQPFIECLGNYAYATSSEIMSPPVSDIYRYRRPLYYQDWRDPWQVTATDPQSESPVCYLLDDVTEVHTYAEMNPANSNYDIQYRLMPSGSPHWIAETQPASYWPHNQMYTDMLSPPYLYTLWTEGTDPNCYVRFDARMPSFLGKGVPGGYYTVGCGAPEQSRFCTHRTGYKKVGDYSIDYGNDSLVYNLDFLDPCYEYATRLSFIHDGSTSWDIKPVIDGQQLPTLRVRPLSLDTLRVNIPRNLYEKDHAVRLVLRKVSAAYGFCQNIKVYRYEPTPKVLSGGGQTATLEKGKDDIRLSVTPTVASKSLRITYGLASPSGVRIVLYDAAGRIVATLRDSRQTAGRYTIFRNLNALPNGVYFVRLAADDRLETKKVVVSR